jgi:hypothetical protein
MELAIKPYNLNDLENAMVQMPQADCPVRHIFSPGTYTREVTIPAGTVAIGHYQRKEHLNVFIKGRVTMLNEDGSKTELVAPMVFTGNPGRKCGYIHEDVVWLNVYPTDETDVETLENTYLDKSLSAEHAAPLLLMESIESDRKDYQAVLAEYGFTEATARQQSEDAIDQIPFPAGAYKVRAMSSPIEGIGLFATGNISDGEIICPARISGKRTPAGRYCNHSKNPNAEMILHEGDIYLIAIKPIQGYKGGDIGEEITTDYRNNLKLVGGIKCQG